MARKPVVNLDDLVALGAEKLALLVLDQSGRDSGFKKLVAAALAGTKGPKAVAAIIDRRIAALERARGFLEWDRAKTFAADLDMTVKTIVEELGRVDATMAIERLLKFIATHQSVFERVDDSNGRVQDIYATAIDALEPLAAAMPEMDRDRLPDLIMTALANETHGYLPMVVRSVASNIPSAALARWDAQLAALQAAHKPPNSGPRERAFDGRVSSLISCRQAIAEARGDLDGFIALEETKHVNFQNTLDIAERLRAAKRLPEALAWVRRKGRASLGYMSHADVADGAGVRDAMSKTRVSLEAHILEELGDKASARELRWAAFTATLDAEMLHEHIAHLDDFAEFEVLDRAFEFVAASPTSYRALFFFIRWPQPERAARLVIERKNKWDGRHYDILLPAAETLQDANPTAATILYRALLSDILTRARSMAYGHAARYLARLDDLAAASDAMEIPDLDKHVTFRAGLLKTHGRKSGFWAQVAGKK